MPELNCLPVCLSTTPSSRRYGVISGSDQFSRELGSGRRCICSCVGPSGHPRIVDRDGVLFCYDALVVDLRGRFEIKSTDPLYEQLKNSLREHLMEEALRAEEEEEAIQAQESKNKYVLCLCVSWLWVRSTVPDA